MGPTTMVGGCDKHWTDNNGTDVCTHTSYHNTREVGNVTGNKRRRRITVILHCFDCDDKKQSELRLILIIIMEISDVLSS